MVMTFSRELKHYLQLPWRSKSVFASCHRNVKFIKNFHQLISKAKFEIDHKRMDLTTNKAI